MRNHAVAAREMSFVEKPDYEQRKSSLKNPTDWINTDWEFIEDITRPRGDTKFLFECWKTFHEWAHAANEWNIFLTREEKFRIS